MVWETGVHSQVESCQRLKKCFLIPPCLTLTIIKFESRVKWNNPEKGLTPSHTPWCSSYWKESLQVAFDYGRRLYFLLIFFKTSKLCSMFLLLNLSILTLTNIFCRLIHHIISSLFIQTMWILVYLDIHMLKVLFSVSVCLTLLLTQVFISTYLVFWNVWR